MANLTILSHQYDVRVQRNSQGVLEVVKAPNSGKLVSTEELTIEGKSLNTKLQALSAKVMEENSQQEVILCSFGETRDDDEFPYKLVIKTIDNSGTNESSIFPE